jgi:hypothetical protein
MLLSAVQMQYVITSLFSLFAILPFSVHIIDDILVPSHIRSLSLQIVLTVTVEVPHIRLHVQLPLSALIVTQHL